MGDVPKKAGTAYERLATAAYSLVHGVDAKFNQYLTGLTEFDKNGAGKIDEF